MDFLGRVSGNHLHILIGVHIENLKLCVRNKNRHFGICILLNHTKLCCKLSVHKHSPDLRFCRMVLRNMNLKWLDCLHVMRSYCLNYHISSIRDRNGYQMSLFICEKLCFSICTNYNRSCTVKIITAIFFYG